MASRHSPLTPQFSFDDSTGQYRWISGPNAGRFVPGATARGVLDDYLEVKSNYALELFEKLVNREISMLQFQAELESTLSKVHLVNTAIARGGWHRMQPEDYGCAGQLWKQDLGGIKGVHNGLRGLF